MKVFVAAFALMAAVSDGVRAQDRQTRDVPDRMAPSRPAPGAPLSRHMCDGYAGQVSFEAIAATPRDDYDAELLTARMGGTLTADPSLYERVKFEIASIRDREPAVRDAHVRDGGDARGLFVTFDAATFPLVAKGKYEPYTCPNAWYELRYQHFFAVLPTTAFLAFKGVYNMPFLAQEYARLPGVSSVALNYDVGASSGICGTRIGAIHHYVFFLGDVDCAAGCAERKYLYFRTTPGGMVDATEAWDRMTPVPDWFTRYGASCFGPETPAH